MRRSALIIVLAGAALLHHLPSRAVEVDPFIGTWVLDTHYSRYEAGELPQGMRIVMESKDNGVHYRSETSFPSGRIITAEYTADYEGHLAPVTGDRGMLLPVTIKRLDLRTQLLSYVSGLKVVATSKRSVSVDGRRLQITTHFKDTSGREHTNIGHYVKSS